MTHSYTNISKFRNCDEYEEAPLAKLRYNTEWVKESEYAIKPLKLKHDLHFVRLCSSLKSYFKCTSYFLLSDPVMCDMLALKLACTWNIALCEINSRWFAVIRRISLLDLIHTLSCRYMIRIYYWRYDIVSDFHWKKRRFIIWTGTMYVDEEVLHKWIKESVSISSKCCSFLFASIADSGFISTDAFGVFLVNTFEFLSYFPKCARREVEELVRASSGCSFPEKFPDTHSLMLEIGSVCAFTSTSGWLASC